ncbi:hypothetical protein [Nocardioides antri]|uniref:hypothetical protein n=1 Tax=Nocardioides antri TaxID=2607659 RepID=UPI00165F5F58|nr:hypothetical protein [Nocardioides antri]
MNSSQPDGAAQAAAQPAPPVDVMEALGLRVQLSFPDFLALPPEQAKAQAEAQPPSRPE